MQTKTIKPVVCLFLILEILDIILTVTGIRYYGLIEKNPLIITLGLYGFLTYKMVASLALAGLMQIKNFKWVNIIAIVITALPVLWNIIQMIK